MRLLVAVTLALSAATANAWAVKQTFVINMARDTERMANMARQLAFLRVPYTRIAGVDKVALRAAVDNAAQGTPNPDTPALAGLVDNRVREGLDLEALQRSPFADFYSGDLGTAGCALSHIHALLTASDRVRERAAHDGPVLVLEDDVQLDSDFVARVDAAVADVSAADPSWSVLAVGHCWAHKVAPLEGHALVARAERYYCAHAYVLRNAAVARRIVSEVFSVPSRVPVFDLMLLGMWNTPEKWNSFRAYVVADNDLAVQDRRSYDTHVPMAAPIPHLAVRTPIPATRHMTLHAEI